MYDEIPVCVICGGTPCQWDKFGSEELMEQANQMIEHTTYLGDDAQLLLLSWIEVPVKLLTTNIIVVTKWMSIKRNSPDRGCGIRRRADRREVRRVTSQKYAADVVCYNYNSMLARVSNNMPLASLKRKGKSLWANTGYRGVVLDSFGRAKEAPQTLPGGQHCFSAISREIVGTTQL